MSNHESEGGITEQEKGLGPPPNQSEPARRSATVSDIEGWMLDAIGEWEQDANAAVPRAWQSLEYTGGGSLSPAHLGVLFGSVLLSSMASWAGTIARVLFTSILPSPTGLDLDGVRGCLESAVQENARQLVTATPPRAAALYRLSLRENWTPSQARTQAVQSVISAEYIRTVGSQPSIDHSRLQDSLELGLLLDVADLGIRVSPNMGGSIPLILFGVEYHFDRSALDNEGNIATFYAWKWKYTFGIQTYGLKAYKKRLKTLLGRLNQPLDVGARSIPLSIELHVPEVGEFSYLGSTQPPVSVKTANWESESIRDDAYSYIAFHSHPWKRLGETRDEQFCYAVVAEAISQTSLLPPIPYP